MTIWEKLGDLNVCEPAEVDRDKLVFRLPEHDKPAEKGGPEQNASRNVEKVPKWRGPEESPWRLV
jgi:hypothetical protein